MLEANVGDLIPVDLITENDDIFTLSRIARDTDRTVQLIRDFAPEIFEGRQDDEVLSHEDFADFVNATVEAVLLRDLLGVPTPSLELEGRPECPVIAKMSGRTLMVVALDN